MGSLRSRLNMNSAGRNRLLSCIVGQDHCYLLFLPVVIVLRLIGVYEVLNGLSGSHNTNIGHDSYLNVIINVD